MKIRSATDDDLNIILEIWLEGLSNSFSIGETDLSIPIEHFRKNFISRNNTFNFWVIEDDGNILGWQSLIPFSQNPFRINLYAESSTYISRESRFTGLAKLLLAFACTQAKICGLKSIIGFVAEQNTAARKITAELGWINIGFIPPEDDQQAKLILLKRL